MLQDADLAYRAGKLTTNKGVSLGGGVDVTGVATAGGSTPLQGNGPQPQDNALLSWSFPPEFCSTGQLATNGTLYLSKLPIRSLAPINHIWWNASTAGATPTSGQNWAAIITSTGAIAASVGVDAKVTSASTPVTADLAAPYTPSAIGFAWVALLFNAVTAPTLLRTNGSTTATNNAGVSASAASLKYATNGTGLTALPGSITPSSNSIGPSIWVAVS